MQLIRTLLAVAVFASYTGTALAGTLSLTADKDLSNLSVGDTFKLSVLYTDTGSLSGLVSFGTHLSFDETVLDYKGAEFNTAFNTTDEGTENSGGFDVFSISGNTNYPAVGFPIGGINELLTELTFDVIGAGSTSVDFTAAGAAFALKVQSGFIPTYTLIDPAAPFSEAVTAQAPQPAAIPTPGAALLSMSALAGLAFARRRSKQELSRLRA